LKNKKVFANNSKEIFLEDVNAKATRTVDEDFFTKLMTESDLFKEDTSGPSKEAVWASQTLRGDETYLGGVFKRDLEGEKLIPSDDFDLSFFETKIKNKKMEIENQVLIDKSNDFSDFEYLILREEPKGGLENFGFASIDFDGKAQVDENDELSNLGGFYFPDSRPASAESEYIPRNLENIEDKRLVALVVVFAIFIICAVFVAFKLFFN